MRFADCGTESLEGGLDQNVSLLIYCPLHASTRCNVEKEEAVERGHLTFVYNREETLTELKFPVELNVGDRHHTAGKERCPTGLPAYHDK